MTELAMLTAGVDMITNDKIWRTGHVQQSDEILIRHNQAFV